MSVRYVGGRTSVERRRQLRVGGLIGGYTYVECISYDPVVLRV